MLRQQHPSEGRLCMLRSSIPVEERGFSPAYDMHGTGALGPALYLIPTTIESGPARCATQVSRNPCSFIHAEQSAPV